jgi:NADPH2:quinone reductase
MLAARYDRPGAAHEVLRIEEIDRPEPGPGEVLVRVTLSGVNPTDWKRRQDQPVPFPHQIPNQDGAGIIEAVGEGIEPERIGERVWLYLAAFESPWGTAAQYTVVPASRAVALPDPASDELGASLGVPALTAHRCLLADGPVAGLTVLVAGGAGAVGHAAIELARWAGAGRVIATTSNDEKAALARAAGAHHVVDYGDADAAEQIRALAPDGVDRIVEVALARNADLDLAVAAPHATIACYGADPGERAPLAVRDLMARNLLVRGVLLYSMPHTALRSAVIEVRRAVSDGALTPLPVHRFPLERTADAHDAVEGGAVGKVVIEVPGG